MRKSVAIVLKLTILAVLTGIVTFLWGCTTSTGDINLIAENAAFNRNQIRVESGSKVTITFENKDNTSHNFAVYDSEEDTDPIYVGETISAGETITYTFTAPIVPGTYYFRCDHHPDTMTGTFTVYGTTS